MTRRTFVTGALLGPRPLPPERLRLRLGFDSYSIRATQWDAIQTLDYAARVGFESVQFSEFPHIARTMGKATDERFLKQVRAHAEPDERFLKQVRAHAERLGIHLEMGTWGVCPTSRAFQAKRGTAQEQLGQAIRAAGILGAKVVRCVVGNQPERKENGPIEKHIEAMAGVCRSVREQAKRAEVKIAIENHKDLRADEMRELVERAGPDYVGVCLDTGNPIWVLEDPLQTVEILAPYALSSHFRDTAVWKQERGVAFQWVAMGEGNVGIDQVVREFARRAPNAGFNLEIIAGQPPDVHRYLEPDFWKGFEKVAAKDFARFLALAERGRPFQGGRMA
ncbi:MAG: sugar phosphate isomerase/epimerase, partial [Acidobacteria bacterium]|nr:sugar phosphate isomerase/epimerase [Acidobacteriota bacterium]